jgi:hypothetical protein
VVCIVLGHFKVCCGFFLNGMLGTRKGVNHSGRFLVGFQSQCFQYEGSVITSQRMDTLSRQVHCHRRHCYHLNLSVGVRVWLTPLLSSFVQYAVSLLVGANFVSP